MLPSPCKEKVEAISLIASVFFFMREESSSYKHTGYYGREESISSLAIFSTVFWIEDHWARWKTKDTISSSWKCFPKCGYRMKNSDLALCALLPALTLPLKSICKWLFEPESFAPRAGTMIPNKPWEDGYTCFSCRSQSFGKRRGTLMDSDCLFEAESFFFSLCFCGQWVKKSFCHGAFVSNKNQ